MTDLPTREVMRRRIEFRKEYSYGFGDVPEDEIAEAYVEGRLIDRKSLDLGDRTPIEWCYVNGLPGYACPDHEMHIRRDAEHDAGRRGLAYVIGVDTFNAAMGDGDA